MIEILNILVFNTKIIDYQSEIDISCFMSEETGSELRFVVTEVGKQVSAIVSGNLAFDVAE